MKKKKIEKEKKEFNRGYIPVIKAGCVLVFLIAALVFAILYKPEKKIVNETNNNLTPDEVVIESPSSCDADKITKIKEDAKKVSLSYEIVDNYFMGYTAEQAYDVNGNGKIDHENVIENYGYAIKVKINNLSDNIYMIISNDIDDVTRIYHNTDLNENGEIYWYESENLYTRIYDVKVYSNSENCTKELYREFNVSLPRWNPYADAYECDIEEFINLSICSKFIFSDKSDGEIYTSYRNDMIKVLEEKEKNDELKNQEESESFFNKIIDYIKNNMVISICIVIGIIALIVGLVVIVKKGKR